MSRKGTLRALTYTINMMKKHDVMTISCNDYFIAMLEDARDLLRTVDAKTVDDKWIKCSGCDGVSRKYMLIGETVDYCPRCGRKLKYK